MIPRRTQHGVTPPGDADRILMLLREAAVAAVRLDGVASDRAVSELSACQDDEVLVAAAVLLSRSLSGRPAAMLLSSQADAAPATTLTRRTAGQLLLLAGHLASGPEGPSAAHAPLAALRAFGASAGLSEVVHGAVWALVLTDRMSNAMRPDSAEAVDGLPDGTPSVFSQDAASGRVDADGTLG